VNRRAFEIAANARRYARLARRPELLTSDRKARASAALTDGPPGPLALYDAALTIGASELDRFSAYVVALLSSPKRGSRSVATLLDSLGVLDPDRVAAIYFALPAERRAMLLRDYACARHVRDVKREVPEAEAALRDLIEETPTSDVGYTLARVNVGLELHGREEHEETVASWAATRRATDGAQEEASNGARPRPLEA
jgi:hypothetical protein